MQTYRNMWLNHRYKTNTYKTGLAVLSRLLKFKHYASVLSNPLRACSLQCTVMHVHLVTVGFAQARPNNHGSL